jgi:SAM-dependent methyltransferase
MGNAARAAAIDSGLAPMGGSDAFPPRTRLRDLAAAPIHNLAVRDHILFQFCPWRRDMNVMEIGPGSGYTAYRLAPIVKQMTLVDTARSQVAHLRQQFAGTPNCRVELADLASAEWPRSLQGYDLVFGLDVFEYVRDPENGLRNAFSALRSGGMLFLSFPNYPASRGDGVTRFATRDLLDEMLQAAGFASWEIFAVDLRPWPRSLFLALHQRPLKLWQRVRRHGRERPQTYDGTWTFRNRSRITIVKVLLHALWLAQEKIMQAGGPMFRAYEIAPPGDRTANVFGLLVVRAWKPLLAEHEAVVVPVEATPAAPEEPAPPATGSGRSRRWAPGPGAGAER